METPDLVDAETAAKAIGVTADTLKRWARRHEIPCHRFSRKTLRFNIDEVIRARLSAAAPPERVTLPPPKPRLLP
ncbi:helix-turn-helix domain-containing protein [Candidatus Nitrospira bockiana]